MTPVLGRLRIAEFAGRFLARLLDGVFLIPVALVLLGLGKLVFPDDVDWWRGPIARSAMAGVYEVGFLLAWGATPGKRRMGLEVVDAKTEAPIGPLAAVVRTAAWMGAAWLPVVGGWLPAAFVLPILIACRGIHDYMARTAVVIRTDD